MNRLAMLALVALSAFAVAQDVGRKTGGPIAPDGKTEVQCDLPVPQRIENIGSYKDGAGMCVMSSIEMCARWANLEQMRGLRNWCAKQPGGAYPSKVDRQLKEYCAEKQIAIPPYVQYEGRDTTILTDALRSGRMVAVTYGTGHMVAMVHHAPPWGTFLDNNAIGENQLIWCDPEEAKKLWCAGGNGWAFVWLAPGPPPIPRNLSRSLTPSRN